MKKIAVMILILLLSTVGVMGYYFLYSKKNMEKEFYEFNTKQVDIINNKSDKEIIINDITISKIKIEDNKYLKFSIKSKTTNLLDKKIQVILYNDYATNPGLIKDVDIEQHLSTNEKYSGEIVVDISDIYNNPYRLEINVK